MLVQKELRRKKAAEASTHKRLRIISGDVAGQARLACNANVMHS